MFYPASGNEALPLLPSPQRFVGPGRGKIHRTSILAFRWALAGQGKRFIPGRQKIEALPLLKAEKDGGRPGRGKFRGEALLL